MSVRVLDILQEVLESEIDTIRHVPMKANIQSIPDEFGTVTLTIGDHRIAMGTDSDGDYIWSAEKRTLDGTWDEFWTDGSPDEVRARGYLKWWTARAVRDLQDQEET